MNNKKEDDNLSVVKIEGFENSRQLGRILSHEGAIQILSALQEKPKIYTELEAELGLPSSTFERGLRDLRNNAHIIRKSSVVVGNRDTKQYVLEPVGKEIIRVINSYERAVSLPKPQQKLLNVEKTKG